MCGDRCGCGKNLTCVGCGAPADEKTSVRLAGGMFSHQGCVSTYGLSLLVHEDEPQVIQKAESVEGMSISDTLALALTELEDLRGDPSLTSTQRRGLRRVGLYAAAGLSKLQASEDLIYGS